jgi:glycosyltransferase involved in cell wall biosynthesis
MRIAPRAKFAVVPLGLDLSAFVVDPDSRARIREEVRAGLGIASETRVVTIIARLVPIKRVDRFLQVANALGDFEDMRFLIVGDGELRERLQASAEAGALGDRLVWTGFRRDIAGICFASDVVVLTSDNEGTPVSLIEAQAAGVPVVSTDVGGARSVVSNGETGFVVPRLDGQAFAAAIGDICRDPELARSLGEAGRRRAEAHFHLDRLVGDIARLYLDLAGGR